MRFTSAVTAVTTLMLCAFASSPSFAINAQGVSPPAAQPGKLPSSGGRFYSANSMATELIRQGLRKERVDPDSPQGKRLTTYLIGIANDPRELKGFATFAEIRFSPASRMRLLRLLATRTDDPMSLCSETSGEKPNLFQMARTLSPKDFDRSIGMMDLISRQAPNAPDEHYDLAGRLEANAWLHKLESEVEALPKTSTKNEQFCRGIRAVVADLDKMPEPKQQRSSYEVFRVIQHKPNAAESIVAAPQGYFDETFDEQALPAAFRRALPAEGSHPLPFSRIVFEGRWVSELPGESGAVRTTFVNRRNNGVVAEMTEAAGTDSKNARVSYALSYGFQNLRFQLVVAKWAYQLGQVRAFPEAPLRPGDALPVPGRLIQTVATEPMFNDDYLPVNQCEIGESQPASEIAHGLTGIAFSVQCASPSSKKSAPYVSRSVWLQDYGLTVNLEWRVDGMAGSFQIDKVAIE